MSRTCTVCRHTDRTLVEQELARGAPLRLIAIQFRLTYSSLRRHKFDHMITPVDANSTRVVLRLADVINVPLQMKERNQIINALLEKALEPLTRTGKGSGINAVQWGFVVSLLKIQQVDEQTILKMTGLLKEGNDAQGVGPSFVASEVYRELTRIIDVSLADNQEARLRLAEALYPMEEIEQDHNTTFRHAHHEAGNEGGYGE